MLADGQVARHVVLVPGEAGAEPIPVQPDPRAVELAAQSRAAGHG
jgi:hypothetical protein